MSTTAEIRADFLGWTPDGGLDGVRWLDHAATTPRLACAIDAEHGFYAHSNANPGRALHRLGVAATDAVEQARQTLADFVGDVHRAGRIVWTRGTTEALNLVARNAAPHAEVWVGGAEHHSNLLPWCVGGRRVHTIPLTPSGDLDLSALEAGLAASAAHEKWVAFAAVSNVIGRIQDVAAICRIARRYGALSVVDAAQAAFHLPLRAEEWDCDFLAFSGHKMGGPMGIGVLWGRTGPLESLTPLMYGGEMVDEVTDEGCGMVLSSVPERLEAGTLNAAGAVGLAAAARWVAALPSDVHARVAALAQEAAKRLAEIPGVRVLGGAEEGQGRGARASLVTFDVEGIHAHDVAQWLDGDGIAVRGGRLCAHPLLSRLGLQAAVRASFGPVNDASDVDALVASVRRVREVLG